MKKRTAAFCAAAVVVLLLSCVTVFAYSGSDFTDDAALAKRIDSVLNGYAQLFQNEDISYPVGSSIGTYPSSPHKTAGFVGYECYIYANAVYNYLFGEAPYHGASDYQKSSVPVRGGTVDFGVLYKAGINCGAYVRTTTSPYGEYNGASGHSFIILEYDREGITVLQANNSGPGVISLDRMLWSEFETMFKKYWGGYVSHIVNPSSSVSTAALKYAAHVWGEWTVKTAATCTVDGVESRVCRGCGKTETRTVAAHHTWDGGTVTVRATWETTGKVVYTCSVCGEKRTETVPKITAEGTFSDVRTDDWFYPSVTFVFRNGLMMGVAPDRFAPSAETDRAMIVTVLWRAEGSPTPKGKSPFSDLTEDWYRDAVAWAAENGIVMGVEKNRFAPSVPLTREQMAAILMRYASFKGKNVSDLAGISDFPDCQEVSDYAVSAVKWAVGRGLIKGIDYWGTVFLEPQGGATRAQIATVLCRYYDDSE